MFCAVNNSGTRISGYNNTGTVQNNSNLLISSNDSLLEITNSSNCKLDLLRSSLILCNNSNLFIKGATNNLELLRNSNVLLQGDSNDCKLENNSNMDYIGNGGNCSFKMNSNSKVHGDGNNVKAERNSNLNVLGNSNRVEIFQTQNHEIKPSTAQSPVNIVKFDFNPLRGGWLFPFFRQVSRISSVESSLRSYIEYVNKAEIHKDEYKVGIFKFRKNLLDEKNVRVEFDTTGMESFNVKQDTAGSTVVIEGERGDRKEDLRLSGPRVIHSPTDSSVFHVENTSSFPNML